jgi:hypothetical protein
MARQYVFSDERNNFYTLFTQIRYFEELLLHNSKWQRTSTTYNMKVVIHMQSCIYSERSLGFTNFELIQVYVSFQRSPEFPTLHLVYPPRRKKFLPSFVVVKQEAAYRRENPLVIISANPSPLPAGVTPTLSCSSGTGSQLENCEVLRLPATILRIHTVTGDEINRSNKTRLGLSPEKWDSRLSCS